MKKTDANRARSFTVEIKFDSDLGPKFRLKQQIGFLLIKDAKEIGKLLFSAISIKEGSATLKVYYIKGSKRQSVFNGTF